jgi:hypothetical protein
MVAQQNINYQQNMANPGVNGVGMRSKNIAKGKPGLSMGNAPNNSHPSSENVMGLRQGMQNMGNSVPNYFGN